jgi:hypothetical protein
MEEQMKSTFFTATSLAVLLSISIAACLLIVSPVSSQEARGGEPVPIGTFRQLHSDVLDEDRLLLVCLPKDYDESSMSYPVLFILYGGQIRGYFAEAVHVVDRLSEEGSIPRMVVVGVANVERYRDLSPVGRRGRQSGIEPFSRFVVDELIPFVKSEYRTKDFRVLIARKPARHLDFIPLRNAPVFSMHSLLRIRSVPHPFMKY